jgi:hypothetical protein
MRPAGGEPQMDMRLVHLPAEKGVERIFSHPTDKNTDQ